MKKQKTLKVLMLSLAMAVLALLPMTTNAQSDGFFRGSMESYENRDAGINSNDGTGITNYGIGEQVPLGSGLLILAAAGAGYAALRRKRNKKGFVMIIALAMIVTMSNCKKKVETINSVAENGVKITLTVDDGSKVNVDPIGGTTYATVNFEEGDVIYVGNNGHYCGYLQHNGTYFIGSISETNLSTADYLHFYFMGNKGTTSQPVSVSIADQTSEYPVISYAHSDDFYHGGGSYSAKLQNYCAIAKFPLSEPGTSNAVYVRGMKNTVTINFAANNGATTGDPYTFSKEEGNGTIKLHSESATEKWAIVLEQGAVTADLLADGFEATTVSVPKIERNTYHASDISSTLLTEGSKLCYSFTSDDKGSVVRFSPGNLQYNDHETDKWRFAKNQWDICQTTSGDWITSGWVDLFGWGTWGSGKTPLNTSTDDNDYTWSTDFQGTLGVHNDWRTLSNTEWQYLFESRTDAASKFGLATVGGNTGIIILPDNFTDPMTNNGSGAFVPQATTGWTANVYTAGTKWDDMEAAGAVFLPAAGCRKATDVKQVGERGRYWSSKDNSNNKAYFLIFLREYVIPANFVERYVGQSVRLVR